MPNDEILNRFARSVAKRLGSPEPLSSGGVLTAMAARGFQVHAWYPLSDGSPRWEVSFTAPDHTQSTAHGDMFDAAVTLAAAAALGEVTAST